MEASDAGDPEAFKETDLFQKCVDMGVIPRTEADLIQREENLSDASVASDDNGLIEADVKRLTLEGTSPEGILDYLETSSQPIAGR